MTRVEQLAIATAIPMRAPYATDGYAGTFLALIPPTIGALAAAWLLGWREALKRG